MTMNDAVSHGQAGLATSWGGDVYRERSSARKRKMALAGACMANTSYQVALQSHSQNPIYSLVLSSPFENSPSYMKLPRSSAKRKWRWNANVRFCKLAVRALII
jgi:hypothetical protein